MQDEEKLNKILERFYSRYNRYNSDVLKMLGETIKQFDGLTPSQAHQLGQELKYSTNINDVLDELSKISGKSVEDINTLFDKTAEENTSFSEVYYEIKNKKYIPYYENDSLRRYVEVIKNETYQTFKNLSKSKNIGFTFKDKNGKITFKPMKLVYRDLIDEAIYKISTGVEDYQSAMRNTINQLANSGVKVNEAKTTYKSGYSRRIDSTVRQSILTGIRRINIGIQQEVGKEFGADGVEISAHYPCAEDHLDIQGRQYSNKEFKKLNESLTRPIGELNCTHFVYSIVLGVSLPSYTDSALRRMREYTLKQIEYKGKKYNTYEATQIQRRLETEIRKQKDRQIIAKASGDKDEIQKAQSRISQLTREYKDFSYIAGLDVYLDRLTVSGYKRVKVG